MSIRAKIVLACLSLTAITLVFGLLAQNAQGRIGGFAVRLYDDVFMSMSYLRSAQNKLLTVSRDTAGRSVHSSQLAEILDDAVGDLGVARQRALSPAGKQAASWLQEQMSQLGRDIKTSDGLPGRAQLDQLGDRFDMAVEINAGDGFRARRATDVLIQQVATQTWVAMAASLAVALAITFLLSRSILPAIRDAVRIATSIAGGKLDNRIDVRGRSETATLLRALSTMQDSIAEKLALIEWQNTRFEAALDNMVQGLCMFDGNGRLLVHNRRFAEMFAPVAQGTRAEQALPNELLVDLDPSDAQGPIRAFTRTLADSRTIAVVEQPMQSGSWVATYEDITDRHHNELRIAHMARHDLLTGLANRLLYRERMDRALAQARRGGGLAVLCLDLDHFKAVNDTLGHAAGDALLQMVAQRLLHETREADTVVRLGGDEFAIIQTATAQPQAARALAERVVAVLGEPFQIGAHQIMVGCSVGVAITMDGLEDPDTLLNNADLALYRAKSEGRGTYRLFEPGMDDIEQARRQLEIDLRAAVAERQVELVYQPLLDASTQQITGFEALARWGHPVHGLISPREFIPLAEETGLVAQIGSIVLEQACRDAMDWPSWISVAVNVSPVQFRNRNFANEVAATLQATGLPAARLELEITEALLLQDSDATLDVLRDIHALGVRIALDDFGTGYSSLSYLRRFPFDAIKIDQSFIKVFDQSTDCTAIIRAVLGLGKSLGMRVIAEGVETEEQLAFLVDEGCDQVQGYLFSKPQPADSFRKAIWDMAVAPRARSPARPAAELEIQENQNGVC